MVAAATGDARLAVGRFDMAGRWGAAAMLALLGEASALAEEPAADRLGRECRQRLTRAACRPLQAAGVAVPRRIGLNVGVGQSKLMDKRLRAAGKASTLVVFPKLDHQLDDSAARTEMLARSDAFLHKAFGM